MTQVIQKRGRAKQGLLRCLLVMFVFIYELILINYYPLLHKWFGPDLGYRCYPVEPLAVLTALVLSLMPSLLLPVVVVRASTIMLWFVYLWFYIPAMLVSHFALQISPVQVLVWNSILLVSFLVSFLSSRIVAPSRVFLKIRLSQTSYYGLLFAIFAIITAIVIHNLEFKNIILNLASKVYERRLIYRAAHTLISGYLVIWMAFWICPLFTVLSLREVSNRRWLRALVLASCAIFGALVVFSEAAYKSSLALIPVTVGVWCLLKKPKYFAVALVAACILFYCLSWVLYTTGIDKGFLLQHIFRRVFVVPGLNASYYWEYFSSHEPVFAMFSIFRYLIGGSVVEKSAPFLIGEHYYGNPLTSANAGFLADAYANLGILGVFLIGIVAGISLRLTDMVLSEDELTLGSALVAQAYALSNSGLLTSILTYGWLLMLMSFILLPRTFQSVEKKGKWGC